ncbi:unnamed protein product [Rotaria socialis]|uniref:Mitochondrial import inner membrane translocase subunit tim16 n=1 Tax=Rotaria socialis TaxID=392032 RepID=A0A818DRH7_9BILA|nr:unnamed protein product [Rotaria socialis]CAF3350053.1 unnamed protein product [Rotaria socialis]CAF3445927.1 unnamed protein product [Rotaria socialis]CAF4151014.1 unnamed protein product [Rotaria socialis]CAF4297161.1 unnamed protein product [Rotaria socialis]
MAKHLIQIAILGSQVIGRAFTRALRQELQYAKTAQQSGKTTANTVQADRVAGMTLQEAKQILNISDADFDDAEKIKKNYEHLFNLNDKTKGGSFYLQSKIYRAKERLDQEVRVSATENSKNSNRYKQKEDPSDSPPS